MNYQVDQIKTEPQEFEECPQQFYKETIEHFKSNNEENESKINEYQPYPNSKQSQNVGVHNCNSINQISEHLNNCHQSTTTLYNVANQHNYNMLLNDEIIKTEYEILDLNSFEVQSSCEEKSITQLQPNQIIHQVNTPNENENSPMFKINEKREKLTSPDGDIVPIGADDMPISSKLTAERKEENKSFILCSLCDKRFLRKCDMIKHKSIHKREKPYKCDQCPKQFSQKSHLTVHTYIHIGKRPFSCNLCGKGFFTKHHMIHHENVHGQEKLMMELLSESVLPH